MSTIEELMDTVQLSERFNDGPSGFESKARRSSAREDHLVPALVSISHSSKWLEEKLAGFLAEHGQTAASAHTIGNFTMLDLLEKYRVTSVKDFDFSWQNKCKFTSAVYPDGPLLTAIVPCVEDIIKEKDLNVPLPIFARPQFGSWARPDVTFCTDKDYAGFTLHHLLIETTTTSVLTKDVIQCICEQDFTSEAGTPLQEKTASLLRQKMIPLTAIIDPSSTQSVLSVLSPLYACLSNYNDTFIIRRLPSLHTGSIEIAGPYSPKQAIPFLATLLLDQLQANSNPDPRALRPLAQANFQERADEDDHANKKKRKRKGLWDVPAVRLSAITYDYDIRGFNDIKYIFSDERMMLKHWNLSYSDSTASTRSSQYSESRVSIPHVTIVAELDSEDSTTLLAKSDGAPLLVWKEIPFDEDHEGFAENEVSMYNGPLSSLQGTVVPTFYGVFYDEKNKRVVLLMEYVGKAIGYWIWDGISPAQRLESDDLQRRLRDVGVEHDDWVPRNICILDGRMRVVDFSQARRVESDS